MTGDHRSEVQHFALQILMVAEAMARSEESVERVRLALITNSPDRWIPEIFPRWGMADMTDQEIDQAMSDPTLTVEYDLDPIPPEEAERIMAEMLANPNGSMRG